MRIASLRTLSARVGRLVSPPVVATRAPRALASSSSVVMAASSAATPEFYRDATLRFVDEVVIGANLCPFAREPRRAIDPVGLECVVETATTLEGVLEGVVRESLALSKTTEDETYARSGGCTTLVVTPYCADLEDFDAMMDVMHVLEDAYDDAGLTGEVQVVAFHPKFQFAGEEASAQNFANRSPFPMFHLLRECDVEAAGETISVDDMLAANSKTLEGIGFERLTAALRALRGEQ